MYSKTKANTLLGGIIIQLQFAQQPLNDETKPIHVTQVKRLKENYHPFLPLFFKPFFKADDCKSSVEIEIITLCHFSSCKFLQYVLKAGFCRKT